MNRSDFEVLSVDVSKLTVNELKSLLAERVELPATQQRKSTYIDMLVELQNELRTRTRSPEVKRLSFQTADDNRARTARSYSPAPASSSPASTRSYVARSQSPSRNTAAEGAASDQVVADVGVNTPTVASIVADLLLFLLAIIPSNDIFCFVFFVCFLFLFCFFVLFLFCFF